MNIVYKENKMKRLLCSLVMVVICIQWGEIYPAGTVLTQFPDRVIPVKKGTLFSLILPVQTEGYEISLVIEDKWSIELGESKGSFVGSLDMHYTKGSIMLRPDSHSALHLTAVSRAGGVRLTFKATAMNANTVNQVEIERSDLHPIRVEGRTEMLLP